MDKITFPLEPGMKGSEVANLQAVLQVLLDKKVILIPESINNINNRELLAGFNKECIDQVYGTSTSTLVGLLQQGLRLEANGKINEPIAAAINKFLQTGGYLGQPVPINPPIDPPISVPVRPPVSIPISPPVSAPVNPPISIPVHIPVSVDKPVSSTVERLLVVSGQVRFEDNLVFKDGLVIAFHQTDKGPIRLGKDTTDGDGRYTISYPPLPGINNINLFVSAISEDGRTLQSSSMIKDAKLIENVDLTLPVFIKTTGRRWIEGQIVLENGLPATKLSLRLYQHNFGGSSALVSETTTLEKGLYALPYEIDGKPSLEIRAVDGAAVDGNRKEIPLSKILHDLGEEERVVINLVAPASLQPLAAEYQRLAEDLKPHGIEMSKLADVRENAECQDLTVLNRKTGWDARLLALATTAAKLSADKEIGLSQEVLYGLFRAGLPSDKLQLARVSEEVVEQALTKAKASGIINLSEQQLNETKANFKLFTNTARLELSVPGSSAKYSQLLKSSGLKDDICANFASVYLNHRGDGNELWEKARAVGLVEDEIQTLQQQGKLAFLTGSNLDLMTQLQKVLATSNPVGDPVHLVDQDLYQADKWEAVIRATAGVTSKDPIAALTPADKNKLEALIPPTYIGEDFADRFNNYKEDMARKVRRSYPTQVVGRMVQQDSADDFKLGAARTKTATFLRDVANKGFRLGQTPIETFLKKNSEMLKDIISAQDLDVNKENTKTLQRVYQMTPSSELIPMMMKLGFTSAHDVVALSEKMFIDRFVREFPGLEEKSKIIYRKAKQICAITYNLFAMAKKQESQVRLNGASGDQEQYAAAHAQMQTALKDYPTLESLFGSMDFCECEHCRSVLSPAAYLVDLLQFIDAESGVWSTFLANWPATHGKQEYTDKYKKPYQVLVERRPDIPYISLTCENTNTALPYIDIVNEILEYYVANEELTEKAAHDTGDATTAELLAEPQNVIAGAYDKLQQEKYPLTLPFDLGTETVRSFCDYYETPLWQLLEAFRSDDAVLGPAQHLSSLIESLGLTPAEYEIFTDPEPLKDDKWYELYGFKKTTPAVDDPLAILTSAKELSRRLGVTYKEVVEIIQTGFVNPKLAELVVLYKLGVSIRDVMSYKEHKPFYEQNKDLLEKKRDDLPVTDQLRFDKLKEEDWQQLKEVKKFEKKVDELIANYPSFDPNDSLNNVLAANTLNDILLLVDPDAGCNFDLTKLRYANGKAADAFTFLKINLFVRLWRKLGWTIEETDRALCVCLKNSPFDANPTNLTNQPFKTALINLAHFKALDERLQLGKDSRLKLITLWSNLATTGKKPLYAQLFLTRSVLKSGEVFDSVGKKSLSIFDDPLGQYLSKTGLAVMVDRVKHEASQENIKPAAKLDPNVFTGETKLFLTYDELQEVQSLAYLGVLTDVEKTRLQAKLPNSTLLKSLLDAVQTKAKEFGLIKGHLLALQGALNLTANDIEHILTDDGKELATAELSLDNVSLLYRYQLLAKALSLSIDELITLKQLSGFDPFKPLVSGSLSKLEQDYPFTQTLRFVEVAEQVKDSGLKIEDLDYLLRHHFDETGKYRPSDDITLGLIKTLSEGIRAIHTAHALPASGTMSDEVLRQKLGLALTPDVVERFLAIVNGTIEFTASKKGVEPTAKLDPAVFKDESSIRVSYDDNDPAQIQKLTYRGVLSAAEKTRLTALFTSPIFAELINNIDEQPKSFFENHLQKQQLRVDGEAGFLEESDFGKLFTPVEPPKNEQDQENNQATLQERRDRIAQAFLPYLQQRLIQQLIIQTITSQTGADAALLTALLTDAGLLANPQSLLEAFTTIDKQGINVTYFDKENAKGKELRANLFADADTGLKNQAKPNETASIRFEGYLEVPTPGAYRFYMVLDKQNSEAELRFDHLPGVFLSGTAAKEQTEVSEYLELKTGVLYRFTWDVKKFVGGDARLLVQGATLPKNSLAQLTLYPKTTVDQASHTLLLLSKALQLIQNFSLTEREIRHLFIQAKDNFGDLSKLPISNTEFNAQLELNRLAGQKQQADAALSKEQAMVNARKEKPALASAADQITTLFQQFLRLAGYVRLKQDLAGGTNDLIDIFETSDIDQVYKLIAKLTRREEITVKASAKALFVTPSFKDELNIQKLWAALQLVERFGVSVTSLVAWTKITSATTTPKQRFAIASDLKESIKARLEPNAWQQVAQPIFDKLRQRQRDALVSYVMHRHGFTSMEQLYEYFLIDPGMEPVVQTSRIRLAISSLQLFVQRCLLNLEKEVPPSVINAKQWEWMKRYRVWEANRKIFLFPENWLEPEFRDDKTHLFTELEGSLLQGDVSNDLVEDAFLNYLQKLDELARLDIVAMHLENDPRILHVIGRTFSEPHKYFYRRYINQRWTPWEPITTEIEGDHLAPVVWRNRLYLFWVTFMEKPEQPSSTKKFSQMKVIDMPHQDLSALEHFSQTKTMMKKVINPPEEEEKLGNMTLSQVTDDVVASAAKKRIEAYLHWSEYLEGKWSTHESGSIAAPSPIVVIVSDFKREDVFIHVSKEPAEKDEERGVYIHLGGGIKKAFYLAGRNSTPVADIYDEGFKPKCPYSKNSEQVNRYLGANALKVEFAQRITTTDKSQVTKAPPTVEVAKEPKNILQNGGDYTLLLCNSNITVGDPDKSLDKTIQAAIKSGLTEIASLTQPVFYQDKLHTFFIEPNVEERTIEDWKEWVVRMPLPDFEDKKDWQLPMIPVLTEQQWPFPSNPGDPNPLWHFATNSESLINPEFQQDWLVNQSTGLLFDGEIIGPSGRTELTIAPAAEGITNGGVSVNIYTGSAIAADNTVIAATSNSLAKSGLTQIGGGLNIVGSGGFNSALAQSLNALNRSGFGMNTGGKLTNVKNRSN